jgi:hypothetical protein
MNVFTVMLSVMLLSWLLRILYHVVMIVAHVLALLRTLVAWVLRLTRAAFASR